MKAMSQLTVVGTGLCGAGVALLAITFTLGTGAIGSDPGGLQSLIFLTLLFAGTIAGLLGVGIFISLAIRRQQGSRDEPEIL